jgi:hypothetical protein
MKQRRWTPGGWAIMLTWGQGFGLGIWAGGSWIAFRVNGIDLLLGPVTLTIQPPIPTWLKTE